MGANNSTRRVSFESDENENITVVKGIRLSENVINRMREPATPPQRTTAPPVPPAPPASRPAPVLTPVPVPLLPPPLLHPIPPPFDPVTSMPPPPALLAPVAEPLPPPPPSEDPVKPAIASSLPEPTTEAAPPPPPPQTPGPVAAAVPEPEVAPEVTAVPTPPPPPPVDEEALRRKITEELSKGLEKDRAKAEQELQAWLESEKSRASAEAQVTAQGQVKDEVSRILSAERAVAQDNLQQAIIRERIATEDEKRRAQLYAKQLEAIEADLQRRDTFYRDQVARLEERSAQFYKVTTDNYHKAADEVSAKYKRYEVYPVCAELQGQILACYRENAGKTLHCSNIAALYLQCVNKAKLDKLKTGG